MTATVLPFKAKKPNHERTDACRCRKGYVCYPHRIAEAVFQLRNELAATDGQLLVDRARLVQIADSILPPLEAILDESLFDERPAR